MSADGGGRFSDSVRRLGRPWELGVFLAAPSVAFVWLAVSAYGLAPRTDFAVFRLAGSAVLHGHSPYVHPSLALLAADDRFVYPTPFAIPFIPFAVVPREVGIEIFFVLSAAAVLGSLRLLGVRDWRCYGVSLLGPSVLGAFLLGTLGPALLLLCAVGWRYRDRTIAGVPLALAAGAKLFLWPVLVWLLVTRRFRAFGAAVATLAATLALWAAIDFHGMRQYPQTVRLLNDVQRVKSYSVQSLCLSLHLSALASQLVAGAAAIAAIAALVLLRQRSDKVTFSAAVVAALVATPILWNHYLLLLFAPIALLRPRLSPLWLLPIVLWITPPPAPFGATWRILIVLAVIGVVACQVVREGARPRAEQLVVDPRPVS